MLKKVLIGLAVLALGFVAFVSMRPADFSISRSATIAAPADLVYPMVADFHAWPSWSPWEAMDPAMARTYEGAPAGTGAIYSWKGNKDVGAGKMTILDSKLDQSIAIKLEFLEPFKSTNDTTFSFAAAGPSTTVTWTMAGRADFMMKAMGVFMDMDKMVGPDFEKGLGKMKTLAEAAQKKRAEAPPPAAPVEAATAPTEPAAAPVAAPSGPDHR